MDELTNLKPVGTESLVDKVESRLLKFFKESQLTPGDAIPKEMDLASTLGVSRTVVRDALHRLRTLGLIESKKRRGMIFKQPDVINNFARMLDPSLLGEDTMRQLFELRLILEMGMADFLFANRQQKDLDELDQIIAREEATGFNKARFSLEREIAFHGKLYQMSNNVTLQKFQDLLLPAFNYVYLKESDKNSKEYHYSKGQFVSHAMLLDVLKHGTPRSFRNAMRRHLEPHFDHALRNGKT